MNDPAPDLDLDLGSASGATSASDAAPLAMSAVLAGVDAPPEAPAPPTRHAQSGGRSRRRSRRRRLRRRAVILARGRGAKVAAIALLCVAVIVGGLLESGFLSSPVGPSADDGGGNSASDPTREFASVAAPPVSAKPTASGSTAGRVSDPSTLLRNSFPDNPLNHLHGAGVHHVVVSVTSSGKGAVIGYLVPTGLGQTYGRVDKFSGSYSMAEDALGPGYLAAVFVQAGSDGTPVTCRVRVDGQVTSTRTTTGSYGRQVCLG